MNDNQTTAIKVEELKRLQQIEQNYDLLLHTLTSGIQENDADGIITACNKNYITMFRYDNEAELLGTTIWDKIPNEQDQQNLKEYLAYLVQAQPEPTPYYSQSHTKDGELLDLHIDWNYQRDEAGQVIGFISILTDITDQKIAQTTLEQSNTRNQILMDTISSGIHENGVDGMITYTNNAYDKIFGFEPGAAIGTYIWDGLPTAEEQGQLQGYLAYLAHEKPDNIPYEANVKTVDGRDIDVYITWDYLRNEAEEVTGFISVTTDITEWKKAEAERQHMQDEVITAQQQAIQELSTPIIPLMDGIIVMPLIGNIDSMRARDLMRALLRGITEHRAKIVILDITGVLVVDTTIAATLDRTIQAARLKGTRTIVTGISDAVAETIVDLGINWHNVETLRDLQTGLIVALHSLGLQLTATSKGGV